MICLLQKNIESVQNYQPFSIKFFPTSCWFGIFWKCNSQMICSKRVIYTCFGCWRIIWVSWNANNVFQRRWFFLIVTGKRRICDVAFLNWMAEILCFFYLQLFLVWFLFRNVFNVDIDKFFSNPEWQVPRILTYFTMFDMMIITMWRMEKMVFLAICEINLTHKYILYVIT